VCRSDQSDEAARDVERVRGIEPLSKAWEAAVLPLNYTRAVPSLAEPLRGYTRASQAFAPSNMRKLLLFWLLCGVLLAGCAGLPGSDPLKVTLAGVESLPGQGMEVRMAVKLRVQNPNDAPVNFDGVAVTLELRGMDFASGVSDARGSVPRFGETVLVVPVTVSAFAVARQVISLASGDNAKVDFVARGKLSDGSFGGARFESKGAFDLPAGFPGTTAPR
jgi:LEA14-like dessication related protein